MSRPRPLAPLTTAATWIYAATCILIALVGAVHIVTQVAL